LITTYIQKKELRELNTLNGMDSLLIKSIIIIVQIIFLNVARYRIVNWINNISNAEFLDFH